MAHRPWWQVLLALPGLLVTCPLGAAVVEFTHANDFTANPRADDLYTFSLAFELHHEGSSFALREHAFTDSEAGLRFDETYLSVGRPLTLPAGWQMDLEAGVLRVGEGLFGQNLQNATHHLLGYEEVDLAYVDGSRLHPTLDLRLRRELREGPRLTTAARLELHAALGFSQHAALGVEGSWRPIKPLQLSFGIGGRFGSTSYPPLEPWVADAGLTWEAGVGFFDRLFLTWSYNHYGIKTRHVNLSWRFQTPWKRWR